MKCDIEWNSLSLDQWNQRFQKVRQSSVLQSYNYARAAYPLRGQRPKWGLIKIDNIEAGLVQIGEASTLFNAIHAVTLDMGPLWFDNDHLEQKSNAFYTEFNHHFPSRFGRKRRVIPSIENKYHPNKILTECHFKHVENSSYETIWVDLTPDDEQLHKNLKQKWRNQLNKSMHQNLEFKADYNGATLQDFRINYAVDKTVKEYNNILPKNINAFFSVFSKTKDAFLANALLNNKSVASALILKHGSSATYQIGLLQEEGRAICANHFLLWNILLELKKIGAKDFDLGGVNAYDAKGIQHFKEGIGGEENSYSGIYS